nr:cyclic dehypoxanthinyl futalosine synthase [Desulfovibrio inopinatus]
MNSNRLSPERARALFAETDVFTLGRMAHAVRMRIHKDAVVTYIVDRNINYTNACDCGCKFCAFYKAPEDAQSFVLSFAQLAEKIRETVELGGYQILLQGGMNPDLALGYYIDMLEFLKRDFPSVAIHGFSPPEVQYFVSKSGLPLHEVIAALKQAGLDSIPGGGAEILVDRVRTAVSPNKCNTDDWLAVMEEAHNQGLRTTATMMFGHAETLEERIEHLERIRSLQDKTGGFTAFIPWTFQPGNTALEAKETSSSEYLKFLALSRLYLDNIDNIQASWVTQGPMIGQLALFFGANDFGSTMIEENVVAAAGVHFRLPEKTLRKLVLSAGFTPKRRNMDYSLREDDGDVVSS